MTGWIIGGAIIAVVAAVLWIDYRSRKAGRADERADNLDKGIQGLDKARVARDDARRDPAERKRLRDKYRSGDQSVL